MYCGSRHCLTELTPVKEEESAMARAPSSSRRGDCSPILIAADTAASTGKVRWAAPSALLRAGYNTRAACDPRSLHSVEGFLENFEIAGVANLFARVLNPFLLQ